MDDREREYTILKREQSELARELGLDLFLGVPDLWYEHFTVVCIRGHVSRHVIRSEVHGDMCPECMRPCVMCQPSAVEIPLSLAAYTIGRDYDQALAEHPIVRKTGRGDQGRDPDYPGGWVWRTQEEAESAARELGFKTYAIELPGDWSECCYLGADGIHHLLHDAVILERVA